MTTPKVLFGGIVLLVIVSIALNFDGSQTSQQTNSHLTNLPIYTQGSMLDSMNHYRSLDLSTSNLPVQNEHIPYVVPGLQPLPCESFLEDVYNGVINISDPNEHKMYARRIQSIGKSGSPFWIAVHNQQFDIVRWETVFDRGQYYEWALDKAYVNILEESSPDARVIDVGGNIGWFVLLSRSLGFSVETFEPSKKNAARLCESLRVNRWSNALERTYDERSKQAGSLGQYVNVYNIALGEKEGKQEFISHPENPGAGSLNSFHVSRHKLTNQDMVEVATLDSFAHGKGWFDIPIEIAILKVDIEGYEPQVFNGATKLLESHMIKNILIELSPNLPPNQPRNNKARCIAMLSKIINAGYSLHSWGGYRGPVNPNPYPNDPLNMLPEFLVNKTLTRKTAQQSNLWFKIA